jgi:hypothetical protein
MQALDNASSGSLLAGKTVRFQGPILLADWRRMAFGPAAAVGQRSAAPSSGLVSNRPLPRGV